MVRKIYSLPAMKVNLWKRIDRGLILKSTRRKGQFVKLALRTVIVVSIAVSGLAACGLGLRLAGYIFAGAFGPT
jgi:hypothetical protein